MACHERLHSARTSGAVAQRYTPGRCEVRVPGGLRPSVQRGACAPILSRAGFYPDDLEGAGGIIVPVVRDPHEVLGIEPGASAEDIRAAWRKASRRTHPDLGGSAEAFREVRDAYRSIVDGEYSGFSENDADRAEEPDPLFVWPDGLSEVTADRWGWRPSRSAMASSAMLLSLLIMVVMLFAPAVLAAQGK